MALSMAPFMWFLAVLWLPLTLLTALGGHRRGDPVGGALGLGFVFPVTWVRWFVEDNRAAGRRAFRSRW